MAPVEEQKLKNKLRLCSGSFLQIWLLPGEKVKRPGGFWIPRSSGLLKQGKFADYHGHVWSACGTTPKGVE